MSFEICEEKSDEELAVLAINDEDAYYCLIKRYEGKLLSYIRKISNFSNADAEDILQEVFLKAYLNLNDFDQDLKFSSWIYRICHNQVIDEYRQRKSKKEISLDLYEENDLKNLFKETFSIHKEFLNLELKEKTEEVLLLLPIDYREVIILKYFENKDYEEISEILKKPMGTIATLLNRARQSFKDLALKYKLNDLI